MRPERRPEEADQATTANILRVDHAGEYGAIRIYEAQRWVAAWRARDLLPFLNHTLQDERSHLDTFEGLMKARRIRPCRTLALWGVGGWALGLLTSLLGRAAILICTEAVERTVHRHLDEQVRWLAPIDPAMADAIAAIQVQELEHLQFAISGAGGGRPMPWARTLDSVVAAATETLIWLSTYGASPRPLRRTPDATGCSKP